MMSSYDWLVSAVDKDPIDISFYSRADHDMAAVGEAARAGKMTAHTLYKDGGMYIRVTKVRTV